MNNKEKFLNEFSYLKLKRSPEFNYPMSQEDYVNYLVGLNEKYLPKKDNLTVEQKEVLEDIFNSINAIEDALIPFRKHKIPYTLGVTGGALYDLITNNSHLTKDIDIVLNFNIFDPSANLEEKKINSDFLKPIDDLMTEYFPNANTFNTSKSYSMLDVAWAFNRFIEKSFDNYLHNKNEAEKTYHNKSLFSLSKITHTSCNRPIDLILSLNNVKSYIQSFDFDLCKNYIFYRQSANYKEYNDLATEALRSNITSLELLDHLYLTPPALKDLDNKTFTMLVSSFDEEDIHWFMEHHYPRLKEKLPHFELNFRAYTENNEEMANFYLMNEKVTDKTATKKKKI